VLRYSGRLLLPDPWSRLLPLAVLSAVFATTQMQLSVSSRMRTSPANVLVSGVLPLIGGRAMLAVFIYGLTTQRPQVSIVASTLVVVCVVVAIAVSMAPRAPYFVQQREVHEVGSEVKDS
jgi:hypothetical protein